MSVQNPGLRPLNHSGDGFTLTSSRNSTSVSEENSPSNSMTRSSLKMYKLPTSSSPDKTTGAFLQKKNLILEKCHKGTSVIPSFLATLASFWESTIPKPMSLFSRTCAVSWKLTLTMSLQSSFIYIFIYIYLYHMHDNQDCIEALNRNPDPGPAAKADCPEPALFLIWLKTAERWCKKCPIICTFTSSNEIWEQAIINRMA